MDCLSCSYQCITCNSATYCMACASGFYVDALGSCAMCPQNCSTCEWNSASSSVNCTSCMNDCFFDGTTIFSCYYDLCGDSTTKFYACDNQIGVLWDGC